MLSYRSMRSFFGLFVVFVAVLSATEWSFGQASSLVLPPSTTPAGSSSSMPSSMPGSMPPGMMPGMMMPGMPGMPGASAPAAPAGPSSAPNDIQALIYPDVVRIVRIDTRRVDYESLNKFTDDLIQYGVGALKMDDKYLVKLRETQKAKLKVAFSDAIAKLQSKFDRDMAPLGVREYYRLRYVKGTNLCGCLAFPLGGVSAQQQTQLRSYVEKEYSPLAVFERFGFLIVIDDHSVPAATVATGKSSDEDEEDEDEDEEEFDLNAAVSGGLSELFGGIFVNTDNNRQQKSPQAQKKLDDKKKAIYPQLVARFSKPAGPGNEMVAAAFTATEGANITYVMKDVEAIEDNLTWIKQNGFELPIDGVTGALSSNQSKLNWSAFCLSLVKEPRAILLIDFADGGIATIFGTVLKTLLTTYRGSYDEMFDEQLKTLELDKVFDSNPLVPIVNLMFESVQVRNSGTQVALILNTKSVLDKADVLVPLFGGVPVAREKKKATTGNSASGDDEEVEFDDEESDESDDTESSPMSPPTKTDDDPFA